jgi:hypothetical protein
MEVRTGGHVGGNGVGAQADLLEEVWDVFVVEGQSRAHERVEDHPTAPHIDLRPGIHPFWCSVSVALVAHRVCGGVSACAVVRWCVRVRVRWRVCVCVCVCAAHELRGGGDMCVLAGDDFGRGVIGRPAARRQKVAVLHKIGQS